MITRGLGVGIAGVVLSVVAVAPSAAFATPVSSSAPSHSLARSVTATGLPTTAERRGHGVSKVAAAAERKHHAKKNKKKKHHKAKVKPVRVKPVAGKPIKAVPTTKVTPTPSVGKQGGSTSGQLVLTPTAPSAQALSTLADVASSNLSLQQTMLTGLRAQKARTSLRSGFTALSGSTQSALGSLPFLATSGSVRTNTGPALMAASAAVATGSTTDRDNAIAAFDTLLRDQLQANGSISSMPTSGDIDTMFFAANLGTADLLLHSQLDAAHRAAWDSAVAGAADFLINNGNLRWYTNGNIAIGNALVEALAYRITGQARFLTAYNTAWSFATAPNQARWPGMGFQTTRQPTQADGSDGAGYFTEEGLFLGFDPDYSMMQSELLARLYVLTRDPRTLVDLNMLVNQLMTRVDTTRMFLDASGGSRHNYPTPYAFDSSALSVLAYLGGRADLVQYTYRQSLAITTEFQWGLTYQQLSDRAFWAVGAITGTIAWVQNPVGAASSYSNFVNGS